MEERTSCESEAVILQSVLRAHMIVLEAAQLEPIGLLYERIGERYSVRSADCSDDADI